jgi:hypothetical protein
MLTYADVCWRMLTYDDVCWRMLTYADVCWRMLTYADICWRMLTCAGICCWRMRHILERTLGVTVNVLKVLICRKKGPWGLKKRLIVHILESTLGVTGNVLILQVLFLVHLQSLTRVSFQPLSRWSSKLRGAQLFFSFFSHTRHHLALAATRCDFALEKAYVVEVHAKRHARAP